MPLLTIKLITPPSTSCCHREGEREKERETDRERDKQNQREIGMYRQRNRESEIEAETQTNRGKGYFIGRISRIGRPSCLFGRGGIFRELGRPSYYVEGEGEGVFQRDVEASLFCCRQRPLDNHALWYWIITL